VYLFLEKHKDIWFTSGEIREAIGCSASAISSACRKLRLSKQIYSLPDIPQYARPSNGFKYRWKE